MVGGAAVWAGPGPAAGQRILWLRPVGVIGVDIGMSNDSIGINNQGGRNGQCPAIITVMFGNIQTELLIYGNEIIGHLVFEAIACGNDISVITEDVHGETLCFGNGCVVLGKLRGD